MRRSQKHDFYRVLLFALTKQELSSSTLEILSLNFTVMKLTKCNSSHLETLIRFCREMFKFVLEQTTTNCTIIVHISFDFLLWQTLPFTAIAQNTASESFVLIAGSFLLQFTKLVIRLSKSVMGAAIKNTGHPGRRFLTASPLYSRLKNNLNRQATQVMAADKNCIPINAHESRFSKSAERIKSKNTSFERLFKAQGS